MDYFLITVGSICIFVGLFGCVLPIIPGPPLSFLGLLLSHFSRFADFSISFLIWIGAIVILISALDYILPVWTTKKFGGTKRGVWGATIGLILGVFFLPPIGIVFGPFIGALIGEMTATTTKNNAIRSALGSFIGLILGTCLKLIVSGIITYYFVVESFIR